MSNHKDSHKSQQHTSPEASEKPAAEDSTAASSAEAESPKAAAPGSAEKPKPQKSSKPVSGKSSPAPLLMSLVAGSALLLAVGVALVSYWQFLQARDFSVSLEQLHSRQGTFADQLDGLSGDLDNLQEQQQSLLKRAEQSEESRRSMLVSLDQLTAQLQSLMIAKGKQPLFWRVSEVEYLLSVANYRLTLERDVGTAKTALQDADNRLRAIGDPGLIPVRERISQELSQLKNVSLPDIPGLAAQLDSLAANVGQLPFAQPALTLQSDTAEKPVRQYNGFTRFVKSMWQDLVDGLFKVQRSDTPIEPLLPPDEKQYLVHNLSLKLEQARAALLQQDNSLFHSIVADTVQWLQRYFDTGVPAVSNSLQTLQALENAELRPELPDISGSLRELRAWQATQQNTAQLPLPRSKVSAQARAGREVPGS